MDAIGSYITIEIVKSLNQGDLTKFAAYIAIFFVIWLEVRGVKKQLKSMNATIQAAFSAGEQRFERVEEHVSKLEHRLRLLEAKPKGGSLS